MEAIVEFFKANQVALIAVAMLIGGIIVKATPTKVDDEWFVKIKGLFGKS